MNPFDLWDQATITQFVREATDRALGNQNERIAGQFAPLVGTTDEKIARGRVQVRAVGKGRGIVADDATPPIFRPKLRFTEEAFSLMRLTEMTPVEESLRRQLQMNGTDVESVSIRDRAGADIITRARAIAVRQETLSDWLIMQAVLNGQLTLTAANPPGQTTMTSVVVDYEYQSGAIMQAPTSFDQPGAKPVDVLRAIQVQLKAQTGSYGSEFWMSTEVMNLILLHQDTVARFGWGGSIGQPPQVTQDMLKSLLWNADNVTFNVTDAGWYDEAAAYGGGEFGYLDADKTRWIPRDTVVVRVPSPDGDPFASMFDGMVPVQTGWNTLEYRGPGAQTYEQLIQGNLTMHYRWEARRFPMIHHPERINVAKVTF